MKVRRNLRKLKQNKVKIKSKSSNENLSKTHSQVEENTDSASEVIPYPGKDKVITTTTFTALRIDNLKAYQNFCEQNGISLDRLVNDALENMFE